MTAASHQVRRAIYISLLMVFIASTASVATRYAAASASIEAIVTVQYLVCTLLCLPITLRPGVANLSTNRLGLHLFRGAVGVLGFYLFYAALEQIPMMDAVLLRQSAPLTVPLVLWLWNRERIPGRDWIPLVIGFLGVGVILRPSPDGLSAWHAAGFISALCLSISMVATHKLATTEPSSRILLFYSLLSLACVAPFSLGDFRDLDLWTWLAMLYIGFSIYLTLVLYNRAYAMAPAHAIAPVNYTAVVLGGLWGWLLWQEVPDSWSLLGSVLVICGGLSTIYFSRSPAPTPKEMF